METSTSYTVRHGDFEGPLDLLLHLVQKRKLFINELSLAQVTDDYLQHVRDQVQQSITDKTSFITVAATLILLKSKSLLPKIQLSNEEESDVRRLEIRLRLYKIFQDIGVKVKGRFGKTLMLPRPSTSISHEVVFSPDENITTDIMCTCIKNVAQAIPIPVEKKPEVVVEKVMSIEDMIGDLTKRIQKSLSFNFQELSSGGSHKTDKGKRVHVIVSFLAVLELVRQGILGAVQGDSHNEITIEKKEDKRIEYVNSYE